MHALIRAAALALALQQAAMVGLLAALKGDMGPVPILGEHYQRWFAGVFA